MLDADTNLPSAIDPDDMITALQMATNGGPRTPRPINPTRPGVPGAAEGTSGCRYCRASLRSRDNYCGHCGMPVDPVRDQPLFVVEGLSNLFNIVFFESLLEQELNRASRYGHPLSVLVVEIDNLTALERAYGYDQTNQLIRGVAEIMSGAIREPDTLAATNRVTALGMQRFMLLLPETDEEGAFRAAEKVRALVGSTRFPVGTEESVVSVSVGVASASPVREEANLVGRATQALIESHERGDNRIQVATDS
jgi:diguanylate cyclase (GGDEF)-like protein